VSITNSKFEARNPKQIQTEKNGNPKRYDLEARTEEFARSVGKFVETLSKTMCNLEYGKQIIRASGSVGANYIEANEALSKKDFVMRIKICRDKPRSGCTSSKLDARHVVLANRNTDSERHSRRRKGRVWTAGYCNTVPAIG
jgi:hypothetical protein